MEFTGHLFRHEAGRMVATLTRIFGIHNLPLAEDAVQAAFCRALEVWKFRGVPKNPSAWLMATAKNYIVDVLRRERTARILGPELGQCLANEWTHAMAQASLEPKTIQDDQLRMMFSCCHPKLSTETQITLILKLLCGFSVSEIAQSLLVGKDAIEKRLGRARKVLRNSGTFANVDASDISHRLEAVHEAVYLLFNEGYHGSHPERTVRDDFCLEAIRLTTLLTGHPRGDVPETHALLALMLFHAARLPGRMDDHGALLQLERQDRSRWNREMMGKGFQSLEKASKGDRLSGFHVEAAIAAIHCTAPSYEKTDWERILELYDTLYALQPTPIVAFNRAIVLGQARGPEKGLLALRMLPAPAALDGYPFYYAAWGEFYLLLGQCADAARNFAKALRLGRSRSETEFFDRKIKTCTVGVRSK